MPSSFLKIENALKRANGKCSLLKYVADKT